MPYALCALPYALCAQLLAGDGDVVAVGFQEGVLACCGEVGGDHFGAHFLNRDFWLPS